MLSLPIEADAFDLLNLHCLRQEQQLNQIYLSEIHFTKAGAGVAKKFITNNIAKGYEGELDSYSLHGTTKTFVSGYNLYAISYHDEIISGLTGDPVTGADGSFTITRLNQKNSGVWRFAFSNTSGQKINADFKCIYNGLD